MAQTPPQAPNPGIEPPSSLAPSLPSSESTGHAIRINFPEIAMLVRHKRFHEVVKACESMEISVPDNGDPSRLLLTTPLVLACLILDDIPPAYQALRRLPGVLAESPLPQGLFAFLASVSERRYPSVYTRIASIEALANNGDAVDAELGILVTSMTAAFRAVFQRRTIELLSRAYAFIPAYQAAAMLDMPVESIISRIPSWSFDAATGVFTPTAPSQANQASTRPSRVDLFDNLAAGAAYLESVV